MFSDSSDEDSTWSGSGSGSGSGSASSTPPSKTKRRLFSESEDSDDNSPEQSPNIHKRKTGQVFKQPAPKRCKRKNRHTGWQCENLLSAPKGTFGFCDTHWNFQDKKSVQCAKSLAHPAKRSSPARIATMASCPSTIPKSSARSAIQSAVLLGSGIDADPSIPLPTATATSLGVGASSGSDATATATATATAIAIPSLIAQAEPGQLLQLPVQRQTPLDELPDDFVAIPGQPYPWHNTNYALTAWHIELGLGGRDLWEPCFRQMTLLILKHRFPAALWCWERGPRMGHRHMHLLCRMHMPRNDQACTFLREEIYGWFHNGLAGDDNIPFRHNNGAELHVAPLKEPDQSWESMRGYLQKCRGRGFYALEVVCSNNMLCDAETERTLFNGRRSYALCSTKREGTPLQRKNLAEHVFQFASAELPHLPWLTVIELLRFMLICDSAAKSCPGNEFVLDNANTVNPHALQLMLQWSVADDDDLPALVTLDAVAFLFFRQTAAAESRVASLKIRKLPERLCTSPSYAAYSEDTYNYDTMSFARVRSINREIMRSIALEHCSSNAENLSNVPLSYQMLQDRYDANITLCHGAREGYPTVPELEEQPEPVVPDNDNTGDAKISTPRSNSSITPMVRPFYQEYVQQLQPWLQTFRRKLLRYSMLVIAGPPRCGKTVFAEHALGFKHPLVVTGGFDLTSFDRDVHDAIIFDDVCGIVDTILKYRSLFQSRDVEVNLSESATNMYSFKVNLHRIPLIVVMNLDTEWNKLLSDEGSWIRGVAELMKVDKPMSEGAHSELDSQDEHARAAAWEQAAA